VLGSAVPLRTCAVSFLDIRGIRHVAEVSAGSLYEAAVLGIKALRADEWTEHLGPATVLEIEVREPTTKHVLSVQQVERWLDSATTSPNEAVKKAKLKSLLVSG
jgi:hypothetical protein